MEAIVLDDGEKLFLHEEMVPVVDSLAAMFGGRRFDVHAERRAMTLAIVAAFHNAGMILVPRARNTTREAVNADLYSLALSWKGDAERRMRQAADLLFPVIMRDDGDGLQSHDLRDMLKPLGDNLTGKPGETCTAALVRLSMAAELLRPDLVPLQARPTIEPATAAEAPCAAEPGKPSLMPGMARILAALRKGGRLALDPREIDAKPRLMILDHGAVEQSDEVDPTLILQMGSQNLIVGGTAGSSEIVYSLTKRGREVAETIR